MPEPVSEFVAGDARRLPGGVRLVGYRSTGLPEGVHLGVPGASLTFILSLDGPVVAADTADELATGRGERREVLLAGLQERATHVEQPTRQEGVQLAIDPLACRALFGLPAAELPGTMDGAFVAGRADRDLWQRVGETPSWEARFALVATEFAGRVAAREGRGDARPRPEIAAAWRLLRRHRGRLGVDALAREVALSPRHLRAEFRRELGVGPKGAARLMRFEHALATMTAAVRAGREPSLARIAAGCGYADQSHLAREFRTFLGTAPSSWLAQERRNIQAGGHALGEDWTS